MIKRIWLAACASAAILASLTATGCTTSHEVGTTSASASQSSAQPFNPAVSPADATAANSPCYSFEQAPAPVPPPTAVVKKQLHRYLHVVYKGSHCYLADNFGHDYNCGRTSTGELYPVYQDTVTDAVYPLYYDQERDDYYRCVDNTGDDSGAPVGYYRNYIGYPENVFYEGDSNQEEECQSDDSQPFILNYETDDSGYAYYRHHHWHGFNASYGNWSGPDYNQNQLVVAVPVIVAAFILFDSSSNQGGYGGGNYNNNEVVVNNHYYYQRSVFVNNFNNHPSNARFTALPGPPLGHFGGFRRSNHRVNVAHALPPVILPGAGVDRARILSDARQGGSHFQTAAFSAHAVSRSGSRKLSKSGARSHVGHKSAPAARKTSAHVAAPQRRNLGKVKHSNGIANERPSSKKHYGANARIAHSELPFRQTHKATKGPHAAPVHHTSGKVNRPPASHGRRSVPSNVVPAHKTESRPASHSRPMRPAVHHTAAVIHHNNAARPAYRAPRRAAAAPRRTYAAPRRAYTAPRHVPAAPRHSYAAPHRASAPPRRSFSAPRPGGGGHRGGGGGKRR